MRGGSSPPPGTIKSTTYRLTVEIADLVFGSGDTYGKGDAIALYQQRKSDTRAGAKLPNNLRSAGVRFKELADAILGYSASHHRDTKNIKIRIAKILSDFGQRVAEKVKPEDIDAWLTAHTKTPATSNRYRALFSLVYRKALRNGKVTSNPARLVRQRHEDNITIRWLTTEEEKRLGAVMAEHYPEHIPELAISIGTGMRLTKALIPGRDRGSGRDFH